MRYSITIALVALLCASLPTSTHAADDPAAQVGPHVGSGSVALVHLHLPELPIAEAMKLVGQMVPEEAEQIKEAMADFVLARQALVNAGVHDIYAILSVEGLPHDPGYLIIPKTKTTNLKVIREVLAVEQAPLGQEVVEEFDDVVFVGSASALRRYQAREQQNHPELTSALKAVVNDPIQIILVPSNDDRRVIAEVLPVLPDELGGGPSTVVTRGLSWCAIGAGADDGLNVRVVVQASDPASAEDLLKIWKAGLGSLAELEIVKAVLPKFNQALPLLTPKVSGDALTLDLRQNDNGIQTLIAALKPPLEVARISARRNISMNNLKQIALAMHNFYDVNKRFPAIGTFDATGQPLLSWRVHLLPFLDHAELYNRFRLNEAWDSPHNKALLSEMPQVFACPQSKHRLNRGLATYRLVVGEGTAYPGREGIEISSITDGTSNTIMSVEVDDKHAVEWTKPEGLPLSEENPLTGIGGQFPGGFNAASCDGAVHWIPQTIDRAKFRLLLLRNDGNPVTWE